MRSTAVMRDMARRDQWLFFVPAQYQGPNGHRQPVTAMDRARARSKMLAQVARLPFLWMDGLSKKSSWPRNWLYMISTKAISSRYPYLSPLQFSSSSGNCSRFKQITDGKKMFVTWLQIYEFIVLS
jgi:hypothetical protein